MLNLGSGRKPIAGAVNVDLASETRPDVIHDLRLRPWPFPENHFAEIHGYDVLEHLDDVVDAMAEIHRVSRPGAVVHLTVPHFSCANAYTDPTHRHQFGWFSFHYFTGENELGFYTAARYRRRHTQLMFYPGFINKVAWRLANRRPGAYERRWCWLFPAWFLYCQLEVVK